MLFGQMFKELNFRTIKKSNLEILLNERLIFLFSFVFSKNKGEITLRALTQIVLWRAVKFVGFFIIENYS